MPIVVLDRDGVINEDSDNYIRSLGDWHPIPGSIDAIAALSQAGYKVAIATNQSGLGRGYFGIDELEAIHAELAALVEQAGGTLAGIFYCPHVPDAGCDCRKPGTGLLQAIERELGEPLADAFFVGDSLKDLQAAQAYHCQPLLVRTGKGSKTQQQLTEPDVALNDPAAVPQFDNLAGAAQFILNA